MTLGNLKPWNRTKVEHIQFVALLYDRYVHYFGISKIIDTLIHDFRILETKGIQVNN